MLEKTLERPLDCKEIQPVHPKGNQPWIPIGTMDAEAEAPILWPPDVKSQLIRKDPDAGKDWGQKEKGTTEDEMVRWHHQFNEQVLGQTLGDGEGQWGLAYSSPWGHKEMNTTWQLNRQENWMQTYLQCVRKSCCKTQNSGLRSKEEKLCNPISQSSRCNTQEGLLSVAQTGWLWSPGRQSTPNSKLGELFIGKKPYYQHITYGLQSD